MSTETAVSTDDPVCMPPQQQWDTIVDRMMATPDVHIKRFLFDLHAILSKAPALQKQVNMHRGMAAFYNRF